MSFSPSSAITNPFENQADELQKKLVDFVKYVRGTKPNGTADLPAHRPLQPHRPRGHRQPKLPNGAEHNPRLEAYTKATEAAAKEAGWPLSISFIHRWNFSKQRASH
jgi:hypothetical protein